MKYLKEKNGLTRWFLNFCMVSNIIDETDWTDDYRG